MSCSQFEKSIALCAGSDLPREDELRLELHLADCSRCRRFAAELRESQDAFLRWRSEQPADHLLEKVRRGVLSQIAHDNKRIHSQLRMQIPFFNQRVRFALGTAAACLLFAILWTVWSKMTSEREAEIGKHEPAAAAGVPDDAVIAMKSPVHDPVEQTHEAAPVRRPALRAAVSSPAAEPAQPTAQAQVAESEVAPPSPPLRIELQTADPNVRIIWFVPQPPKEKASTGPVGGEEPGAETQAIPAARHGSIVSGRSHGPKEVTDEKL